MILPKTKPYTLMISRVLIGYNIHTLLHKYDRMVEHYELTATDKFRVEETSETKVKGS